MDICIEQQRRQDKSSSLNEDHLLSIVNANQTIILTDKCSANSTALHLNVKQPNFTYPLLENVHFALQPPTKNGRTFLTRGKFKYFHYNCDGHNDIGWGCAYRTLQSVCSWIEDKLMDGRESVVPSILEIQQLLVDIGDKPFEFFGSREWIGAMEVFYVIDGLYDIPCKIMHVPQREDLKKYANILKQYFEEGGGVVMMGGDEDTSSKGIAGLHISGNQAYFLVIDPHFVGRPKSAEELIQCGYIRWQHSSEFVDSSFYNLCLPQI
ncbi:probable Ufm1-specific protease 1 [Episyrphus balteatus]|uniref:probable Ufm1-specific protease 1 n=1 Tax=Episyrphus balteatus TaxID=286459 RepID=UPI0024851554|nr:probable Ufm1-specific protease 1 [Episyrphus balteatus]